MGPESTPQQRRNAPKIPENDLFAEENDATGVFDVNFAERAREMAREKLRQDRMGVEDPVQLGIAPEVRQALEALLQLRDCLTKAQQGASAEDAEYIGHALDAVANRDEETMAGWIAATRGLSPETKGQILGLAAQWDRESKKATALEQAAAGKREQIKGEFANRVVATRGRQERAGTPVPRGADVVDASEQTMAFEIPKPKPAPTGWARVKAFFGR